MGDPGETGTEDFDSFWFEFGRGLEANGEDGSARFPTGVGVTAPSVEAALDLVRRGLAPDRELPPVMFVAEGVVAAPGDWVPTPPTPTGEPGIWWPHPTHDHSVAAANLAPRAGIEPQQRGLPEVDFQTAALRCEPPAAWPSAPVVAPSGSAVEVLAAAEGARRPGASAEAIAAFEGRFGVSLPEDLRAILRWSDGWEGELGDGWLSLNSIEELWGYNVAAWDLLSGLLNIGNTGGGETYVLDYRGSAEPLAFVAFDGIDDSYLKWIAPTVSGGLARLSIGAVSWADGDEMAGLEM